MASFLHHHTRDEIKEWLAEAESIVDELELTDKFAEIAFIKAVDLLAAKQLFITDADVSRATPIVVPGQNHMPTQ